MQFVLTFSVIVLAIASILFTISLIIKKSSPSLRIAGMVVDLGAMSIGHAMTGETGAPWYGLYLWVILGNGFRYGEKYLYLSTVIAIIGFGCAVIINDYWNSHSPLAIGLAVTLILIPAYSAILIRRLNEARQRADAASRAKSDFLSCMSHEIRTPLNGILGMTDLLRLRPLAAEDKDCIETIHASGHALARQINEILDLSKIEAGKMTLESIQFDLYVLANTTLRIFQSQARNKKLELSLFIDPCVPYLFQGDPHKIRQIITNLVGNALKFTTRGSITLSITNKSDNSETPLLRFEVIDTGSGIPEDRLQAIFDPFTQASNSITRNYGGTGLGTTICKNLVELMNGCIGVNSRLGQGSTFWFEIPLHIATTDSTDITRRWTAGFHIAYLSSGTHSDDPAINTLLDLGFSCDVYSSPRTALDSISAGHKYDAIICSNPTDDCLDILLTSEAGGGLSENTAVILLGTHPPTDMQEIANNNVFVIAEPLGNNRLMNALHACYARHGTEEDITDPSGNHNTGKQISHAMHVLVSDDNATNRVVMQRMLEKLGHRHTIVDGGEAALNALESGHFDAVIIDKNMPDMGGLEVFQAYCFAHSGASPVEFAILTADATEEAKKDCTAAGIRHFLTKPVSLSRLEETLANMQPDSVAADDTGLETVPDEIATQHDAADGNDFNESEFNKLSELSGDDPDFVSDIIENYISDTNENIRSLEAAVAQGDWLKFRDLAHALKGSSLYLGLIGLAHLAREAQDISREDFSNQGIARVIGLRKSADSAFELLRVKLAQNKFVSQAGLRRT